MVHIYNIMEYYSAIKRNKIGPFAEMWIDLEIVILSEVSQEEKNRYQIISLMCGILENDTDNLFAKRNRQMWRTNLWISRGVLGRMGWEIGIDIYILLCIKQVTNENLLQSTWNST